jgi:hypothetical protein
MQRQPSSVFSTRLVSPLRKTERFGSATRSGIGPGTAAEFEPGRWRMRRAKMTSRRRLLVGSTVAGFLQALGCIGDCVAQQKINKQAANYQNSPKGQQRCEICLQFRPPAQCAIVQGPINPKGWCQYFAARENAE